VTSSVLRPAFAKSSLRPAALVTLNGKGEIASETPAIPSDGCEMLVFEGAIVLIAADDAHSCVGADLQSSHASSCLRRAPLNGPKSYYAWNGCSV
jgi:hypothetical protein